VDASTLARWERGEREPAGQFAVRAERFVTAADAANIERKCQCGRTIVLRRGFIFGTRQ
jgi:hypothetical protein